MVLGEVEVVTNWVFEVVGIGAAAESWVGPTMELASGFGTPGSGVRLGEGSPKQSLLNELATNRPKQTPFIS